MACQEPSGSAIALLIGGIIGSVAGGIACGVVLLIIPLVLLGLGLGSVAGGLADEAAGALVPLGIILRMRHTAGRGRQLMASGRKGIGTVVSASVTGVTINNNPQVPHCVLDRPSRRDGAV